MNVIGLLLDPTVLGAAGPMPARTGIAQAPAPAVSKTRVAQAPVPIRTENANEVVLQRDPMVVNMAGTGVGKAHGGERVWKLDSRFASGCVFAFDIRFDNFDFVCQGKVGGMQIGRGRAVGCTQTGDGASHRLMWKNSGAQSYVYVPKTTYAQQPAPLNQAGRHACGTGMFSDKQLRNTFRQSTWHRVEIGTKLNAPGKRDGVLSMSVDGRIARLDGVVWRTGPGTRIENVHFAMFWGGGCVGRRGTITVRNVTVRQFL